MQKTSMPSAKAAELERATGDERPAALRRSPVRLGRWLIAWAKWPGSEGLDPSRATQAGNGTSQVTRIALPVFLPTIRNPISTGRSLGFPPTPQSTRCACSR